MAMLTAGRHARAWLAGGAAAAACAAALPLTAHADKKDDETRGPLFDPEALERGAKALREINKSPNAKQVIELSRQQEVTKQAEQKAREAELRAHAAQLAKEQEAVRWEEQRRTMAEESQRQAQLAQYQDELARKRAGQEHELSRQRNAELLKAQEDSAARREGERLRIEQQIQAERRAADQYAAELQKQVERERVLAEAEGRIKEGRENEDVNRRAALLGYQEATKKAIESINAVFDHLGAAARDVLSDQTKLVTLVAGATALAAGVYGAREGTRVAGRALERWLGTPSLVRETSRPSLLRPGALLRSLFARAGSKSLDEVRKDFKDIVLPGALHDHVRSLAAAAANTKRHGAPYRHMLFYGPPGTGKTMAAKRLARTSGLDYAILSGGDVAPLGGAAVTQLHATFDWAERSRKGLLLFIDEADAFLGRRSDSMSEGLRGALNAMLFRTGDQSRDFMVVLATNRPGDLDDAVLDRIDEALEFGLPERKQRRELLAQYLDTYVAKAGSDAGEAGGAGGSGGALARASALLRGRKAGADAIAIAADVTPELVERAADATEGFSAREIAKLMASMQAAAYGTPDATLTRPLFERVLQHKLDEHAARRAFVLGHHGVGAGGGASGGDAGGGAAAKPAAK